MSDDSTSHAIDERYSALCRALCPLDIVPASPRRRGGERGEADPRRHAIEA